MRDARVTSRDTLTLPHRDYSHYTNESEPDQVTCKGCDQELGECDPWYGVKCGCGTIVCPGYQIFKVGGTPQNSFIFQFHWHFVNPRKFQDRVLKEPLNSQGEAL